MGHPKVGASWEGFVLEQALAVEPRDEAAFWATHHGAEIDLILRRGDRLLGIECKRADAPRRTLSIRTALEDLALERMAVVYPGNKQYPLGDRVEALPLTDLATPGGLFGEGMPWGGLGRAPRASRLLYLAPSPLLLPMVLV